MTFLNSMQPGSSTIVCPRCGAGLEEMRAGIHYGRLAVVDKCSRCRGVWFDKWELYALTEEGLRSLLNFEAQAGQVGHDAGDGLCPRCLNALVSFKDPSLPRDINILRCEKCSGAWLDNADIAKYSRYKENVLSAKKEQFKETETAAIREYEKNRLGKVRTPAYERIDLTPANDSGASDGAGLLDDGATGVGDCGGGGDGGGSDGGGDCGSSD